MKAIMIGMTALIFFAGAAALSWFTLSEPEKAVNADTAGQGKSKMTPNQPAAANTNAGVVGIHSRPANPEQLFRMGVLLREQQQGLIRQKESLQEQEGRLKLVYQDIDNHQRQLAGMYAELRDGVATGETLLEQLRDERAQLEAARQQAETRQQDSPSAELDATTAANIKQMSRWIQSMESTQAAKILGAMANNGQTDLVVRLLSNIEDRNVSKILDAMGDTPLVGELLMRMKELVRTARKPGR
jgi:hypothetical protein